MELHQGWNSSIRAPQSCTMTSSSKWPNPISGWVSEWVSEWVRGSNSGCASRRSSQHLIDVWNLRRFLVNRITLNKSESWQQSRSRWQRWLNMRPWHVSGNGPRILCIPLFWLGYIKRAYLSRRLSPGAKKMMKIFMNRAAAWTCSSTKSIGAPDDVDSECLFLVSRRGELFASSFYICMKGWSADSMASSSVRGLMKVARIVAAIPRIAKKKTKLRLERLITRLKGSTKNIVTREKLSWGSWDPSSMGVL